WIVEPDKGAGHLHDRPPSVESCDLGVSLFPVSAGEIADLSLEDTLRDVLANQEKEREQSEIHQMTRGDLDFVWIEQHYKDEEYKRDARFRVALVRGPVLCLISMNYWANRAAGLERVWDEVLRTLVMGVMVDDPTAGPVIQ